MSKHFDRVVIGGHVEGVLNRLKWVGRCAKRMVVAVPGRYKVVGRRGRLQLQQEKEEYRGRQFPSEHLSCRTNVALMVVVDVPGIGLHVGRMSMPVLFSGG